MLPLPHRYRVRLTGGAEGHAEIAGAGVPSLTTAAPREFDGPGDAWSPEYLLLAAVSSCFLLTLRAVASASGLEFAALDCPCEGVVDKQERTLRFTSIVLRPRLQIRRESDREKALRVIEKSGRGCLVSASLATPVLLEATIDVAEPAP